MANVSFPHMLSAINHTPYALFFGQRRSCEQPMGFASSNPCSSLLYEL